MAGRIVTAFKGAGVRVFWNPQRFTTPTTTWPTTGQHQQGFIFFNVVNGSPFTLWANGKSQTVFYSTVSATMITNLQNALLALTGLTWTGAYSGGVFTLTCSTHARWARIYIASQPTTGKVDTYIVSSGAETFSLDAKLTNYSASDQIETVDVTPIMQIEEDTIVAKSVMTFSLSLYAANEVPAYILYPGATGTLTVFENYYRKGSRYQQFYALIETFEDGISPGGVIELSVTGRRKGRMIAPYGSIY